MFESLKNHIPKPIVEYAEKEYAVLLPLIETENSYQLLFEVRSNHLSKQPGEVCFPGGRLESMEMPKDAAIRETCEELEVLATDLQVIGALDYFVSPFGTRIYPFLGILSNYHGQFSKDEVDSVFTVPLSYFVTHKPETYINHIVTKPERDFPFHKIPHGEDYPWAKGKSEVHFYEYDGHIIWGLTAKLLYRNLKYIKELI